MKQVLITLLAISLFATGSAVAVADAGLESPFSFGAGARELALGGSSLYHPNDAYAVYWNPSALALTERFVLSGFHTDLFVSGTAYQYLGIAYPTLDYGTIGLGVFRLAVDGIEKRDASNFLLNEFDDSRLGIYLSYGRMISGYSVGASISFEQHSLDTYKSSSSPGLTLSAGREIMLGGTFGRKLNLTAVWRNVVSPSMKLMDEEFSYPNRFELAAGIDFLPSHVADHRLVLTSALVKANGVDADGSFGLEYSYQEFAAIRSGWQSEQYSFGVGLRYQLLEFDYALVSGELGTLHMFSLSTSFGQTVTERLENRQSKKEDEFNKLMNNRLIDKNRSMISSLIAEGQAELDSAHYAEASSKFERALFLARSINDDITLIKEYATKAQNLSKYHSAKRRYSVLIDSATVKFQQADYVSMRYFAAQAVSEMPGNADSAQLLLETAEAHLEETYNRDEMIQSQIQKADSLLNYGKLMEARAVVQSLYEYAPGNNTVISMRKRIRFEVYSQQAREAYNNGDKNFALSLLDSALVLYPGHSFCISFKNHIEEEVAAKTERTKQVPQVEPKDKSLSPEIIKEVETAYATAQKLFTEGSLREAIKYWEKVERLAPDYKSVRDYLIKGYKYVGVELYSQNQLEEAIRIWESAYKLDPSNEEINSYISRTRNEISKMKELSYEFE